jgi:hypothetical protein
MEVNASGTHTLAYYDTAIITAVKSFIVQAPGLAPEAFTFWDNYIQFF